jgi:hypothetical protein
MSGIALSRAMQSWATHRAQCMRCAQVDFTRSATFGNACLDGAGILKNALALNRGAARNIRTIVHD